MNAKKKNQKDNTDAIEQIEVIEFLCRPAAYSPSPCDVAHIETHGAHVFLAGNIALKIKRAVKLSYLDYSTLAAQIYRRVVPITFDEDGTFYIGGDGRIVEWAIEMNRFDEACLLYSAVKRGALPDKLSKNVADTIERYHRALPPKKFVAGKRIFDSLIEQISTALATAPADVPVAHREAFERGAQDMLKLCEHCLDLRAKRGYIRRCHGDLHLSNIAIIQGEPVLFDAIEFDDHLATIDVLYDMAFLLMDLMHYDHKREANVILNRYLCQSDDASTLYGLQALPLFLACRAAVRAMVTLDRDRLAGERSAAQTQKYLMDALNYLHPPPSHLIAVGGLSGTGKSTLAASLSPMIGPAPGAIHLRTDLERKMMFRTPETRTLPQEAYTKEISGQVYQLINRKAAVALKTGHGVVVDGVFADPTERADIEGVARRLGTPFTGIWLAAPRDTLVVRVAARTGDASDATPDIVDLQLCRNTGPIAWTVIDASGKTATVLDRVIDQLELEAPSLHRIPATI